MDDAQAVLIHVPQLMILCGGYKATPAGPQIAAAVGFGLSMVVPSPLPARVHTVPRRSSLQHEYEAAHTREWSATATRATASMLATVCTLAQESFLRVILLLGVLLKLTHFVQ